jgi:hypothetical protein
VWPLPLWKRFLGFLQREESFMLDALNHTVSPASDAEVATAAVFGTAEAMAGAVGNQLERVTAAVIGACTRPEGLVQGTWSRAQALLGAAAING